MTERDVTVSSHVLAADEYTVRKRMEWVDLAKGLTIVLIVFAHTLGKHYMRLDWDIDLPIRAGWLEFNRLFGPMRMPLFLLLSGFLASRSLERGDATALVRRVANPYLLYLIWFALFAIVLALFDPTGGIEALELTMAGLVRNLALPQTTLWYMLALALFYLGATLLRPLGVIVPLAGAAAMSAAVFAEWLVLPNWTGTTESMLRYFPFFLIGALVPKFALRVAGLRSRPLFLLALLGYLGIAVAYRMGAAQVPLFGPIAGVAGAAMGIMLAVRMSYLGGVATGLASIGRRTLPIFVLHVPFLAVVHWVAVGAGEGLWTQFLGSPVAAVVYPAVGTLVNVGACLSVYAGLRRTRMGWLFALPFGRQPARTNSEGDDSRPERVPADPRRGLLGPD